MKYVKILFDYWTFVHFSFWFVVGANVEWHSWPVLPALGVSLFFAFVWEVFELVAEERDWVTGSEHWLNRWVSDPAMALAGVTGGYFWVGLG